MTAHYILTGEAGQENHVRLPIADLDLNSLTDLK